MIVSAGCVSGRFIAVELDILSVGTLNNKRVIAEYVSHFVYDKLFLTICDKNLAIKI